MKLLSRDKLIRTGPVDYADWNYRLLLGTIQRLRFTLALSLLPPRSQRLLEIGYGSGILMPALKEKASELYGVDIHHSAAQVAAALAKEDVVAHLSTAHAETLSFEDDFFDSVLAISSLEFITNIDQACLEIRRVLRPGGVFIVVTPGHSRLVDLGLKVLTGNDAEKDFGDKRQAIIPTLKRYFSLTERKVIPPFSAGLATLYQAVKLTKTETR